MMMAASLAIVYAGCGQKMTFYNIYSHYIVRGDETIKKGNLLVIYFERFYGHKTMWIDPLVLYKYEFEYQSLYVKELSLHWGSNHVMLLEDATYNLEAYYTQRTDTKYYLGEVDTRIFKDIRVGEEITVTSKQVYSLDNGPLIEESFLYTVYCTEEYWYPDIYWRYFRV
jgi:hypothetical protein